MSLSNYSTEELQEEITLREKKQNLPEMLQIKNIDFSELKSAVKRYVDFVFSSNYYDDHDWERFIFEEAVKVFYEDDIWDKINEVT